MRVHVVSAVLVGLVGSGIPLGLAEKVTLIFCVLLVFFAEILNSALEQLVDLAIQQFDEKARVTKDAAAAAVLVLAIGTVVIFAALLVHNWDTVSPTARNRAPGAVRPPAGRLRGAADARPAAAVGSDGLAFVVGLGLAGLLATADGQLVFSALTVGLLVVAVARRSGLARAPEGRAALDPGNKKPCGHVTAAGSPSKTSSARRALAPEPVRNARVRSRETSEVLTQRRPLSRRPGGSAPCRPSCEPGPCPRPEVLATRSISSVATPMIWFGV